MKMEEGGEVGASSTLPMGTRHSDLKKSFKLALRSLLSACSFHEFCKAFERFTGAEQQLLHRLFIQVVTSLHENIEGRCCIKDGFLGRTIGFGVSSLIIKKLKIFYEWVEHNDNIVELQGFLLDNID